MTQISCDVTLFHKAFEPTVLEKLHITSDWGLMVKCNTFYMLYICDCR